MSPRSVQTAKFQVEIRFRQDVPSRRPSEAEMCLICQILPLIIDELLRLNPDAFASSQTDVEAGSDASPGPLF